MNVLDGVIDTAFDIDGSTIAALHRPPLTEDMKAGEAPRLLCLHGWLDNANSFVPLIPHLPAADIVAIDYPGNGASDWLAGGYALAEIVYRSRRVMQSLEWDRCHLVGHSLGGCVAPMLAVAAPDSCASVIMIEASGPLSEEADALPDRLQRALNGRLDAGSFTPRTFADIDAAVAVRMKAANMTKPSARLIVERQLKAVDSGYQWGFDPRWRLPSAQYQTEAQVRSILSAVSVPSLTVVADDGYLARRTETEPRLACLGQRAHTQLPGEHHLHMDDPEPVAIAMRAFLDGIK